MIKNIRYYQSLTNYLIGIHLRKQQIKNGTLSSIQDKIESTQLSR